MVRETAAARTKKTIRRDRIEPRVFSALTPSLLSSDLEAEFDRSLKAELAASRNTDPEAVIRDLRARVRKLQRDRAAIMQAIKDGAPYAEFQTEAEQIEK